MPPERSTTTPTLLNSAGQRHERVAGCKTDLQDVLAQRGGEELERS